MNFRDKLNNFFRGRYGYDELNRFFLLLYLILVVIYLFTRSKWLNILEFTTFIILMFRMLSKNHEKRKAENRKFLDITAPARILISNMRSSSKFSHKIFICPSCRQKVRVPKGKGKIQITCPKCHNDFIKRS